MMVSRRVFSLVYNGLAEMAGTNSRDSRAVGYPVFKIFIFHSTKLEVAIVFQIVIFPKVIKLTRIRSRFLVCAGMVFSLCLLNVLRNTLKCIKPGRFFPEGYFEFLLSALKFFFIGAHPYSAEQFRSYKRDSGGLFC